ncbi:histidine kinase, partial [Prosthecomicrobium hirschii]
MLCPVCSVVIEDEPPEGPKPEASVVEGWELGRRLQSTSATRERFLATRQSDHRRAVVTLYRAGAEPDPAVYEVIRRLPRDHVPEIIAIGRWEGRGYVVTEELTGGTLADLGQIGGSPETVRRIAEELGKALHTFSEAGLRHLDLRPGTILVRVREPLDLVVTGFGSARLAEFDLDIVSPLETNRYMAPETIAGGVAAASDWWSLGMLLLEQVTGGACFEGVNDQAFLIHVLARGVPLPPELDPSLALLLRGLLTADRRDRWQWKEVKDWLDGKAPPAAPGPAGESDPVAGPSITLAGRAYRKATAFALAAAEAARWDEASDLLQRGVIATWVAEAGLDASIGAAIRLIQHLTEVPDDLRLSLALKVLNPAIPLVSRGIIITPGWLLDHPAEGYDLITGPVPDFLNRLDTEPWIVSLHARAVAVRKRAHHLGIVLDEEAIRVHLLATSQARLAALWEQRRRIVPDTEHHGLVALTERRQTTAEDLILLLGAAIGQFRSAGEIVEVAATIAERAGLPPLDRQAAEARLASPRREIYRELDDRLGGFARCGIDRVDEWADQFRLERRMPLPRALVVLVVPTESWKEPPRQEYVSTLLDFFAKRVSGAILRGPLARMTIGKSTPRVSLTELGSERRPAAAILDQLLARSDQMIPIDPAVFVGPETLERRVRSLYTHANLYRRDTGIDGLYLGFPFLLMRDPRGNASPRIAPVLLWPVRIDPQVGNRGHISVGFDSKREEVRLNPAFEGMMGFDAAHKWQDAAKDLLGRTTVSAAQAMDAFSLLATARSTTLVNLPGRDVRIEAAQREIVCAAVLFHAAYGGQAIAEDLRKLKGRPPAGTALETALRLSAEHPPAEAPKLPPEAERYFMVDTDPSQELAVLEARSSPGLLIEGPPGTGKSQTIVNMVADAIARGKSLLIVCQKQSALEVVRKRLEAEGLDRRIVMLTDVNRDREGIVRQVREQIEKLLAQPAGGVPEWRRNRERTAVRIETLEGELDRFNIALHRRDDVTGLSYRAVLSELIAVEKGDRPPVDAPALRAILGDMDQTQLAQIEERCAPLARYWLPSQFEGSPLSVLRPFNPDPASVANCQGALKDFVTAELTRKVVTEQTRQAFPLDDPAPYRAWIDQYAPLFEGLDDHRWDDLRRWAKLFRLPAGTPGAGADLLVELGHLTAEAGRLPDGAYEAKMSVAAAGLDGAKLAELANAADRLAAPTSFLAKLSPWRWSRRRKVRDFIEACGLDRRAIEPAVQAT